MNQALLAKQEIHSGIVETFLRSKAHGHLKKLRTGDASPLPVVT